MSQSDTEFSQTENTSLNHFSSAETHLLTELVNEYKEIIELKKTDFGTVTAKTDTWKKIQEKFCSQAEGSHRTVAQLKKKWANLKAKSKKMVNLSLLH